MSKTSAFGPSVEDREFIESIYPVSRETIARLTVYEKLLHQWQKKTNLVAPSTLDKFWTRHVADSVQLLAIKPTARKWTDIGSGGGFPGMVIAMVMDQVFADTGNEAGVNLVESISKKCAFLRRVAVDSDTSVVIHCDRIESATKQIEEADVVTARALASLDKLLTLTGSLLTGSRCGLFHKGRDYQRELAECDGKWIFDLIVHPGSLDAESVILEVSNVQRID